MFSFTKVIIYDIINKTENILKRKLMDWKEPCMQIHGDHDRYLKTDKN